MLEVINKSRLEQLKALLIVLATEIDAGPGARDMGTLVRQYRETIKEIEEIEGASDRNDEISEILSERELTGQSRAVR